MEVRRIARSKKTTRLISFLSDRYSQSVVSTTNGDIPSREREAREKMRKRESRRALVPVGK